MIVPPRWYSVAPWIDEYHNIAPPLAIVATESGGNHSQKLHFPFATIAACHEVRQEAPKGNVRWNSIICLPLLYWEIPFQDSEYLLNFRSEKYPVYVNPVKDTFCIGDAQWLFIKINQFAFYPFETYFDISDSNSENTPETAADDPVADHDSRGYDHQMSATNRDPLAIFNVNGIVLNTIEHLAIDFGLLHKSEGTELEQFFWGLTKYNSLKDLTIVLPEGKPRDVYPFYGEGYFRQLQTEKFRKISGLLQRWVKRLLDEYLGFDPSGRWKRPTIKVVFHKKDKLDFLGHTDSYHEGNPYTAEGEAEARGKWEHESPTEIWEAWKDILEQFENFEASLPSEGFVPSWAKGSS